MFLQSGFNQSAQQAGHKGLRTFSWRLSGRIVAVFSREERERAVELYFTTSMSTKQVVEHLGYPTATSTLTFSTDPPHVRLSPHAVHEQVRVRMSQWPVAPLVDRLGAA